MPGSGLPQLSGTGTCQHITRTKAINPLHGQVPLDENSKINTTKAMAVNCKQIHHSMDVNSRRSSQGSRLQDRLGCILKALYAACLIPPKLPGLLCYVLPCRASACRPVTGMSSWAAVYMCSGDMRLFNTGDADLERSEHC